MTNEPWPDRRKIENAYDKERGLKPNNVWLGYLKGYRRAIKDMNIGRMS